MCSTHCTCQLLQKSISRPSSTSFCNDGVLPCITTDGVIACPGVRHLPAHASSKDASGLVSFPPGWVHAVSAVIQHVCMCSGLRNKNCAAPCTSRADRARECTFHRAHCSSASCASAHQLQRRPCSLLCLCRSLCLCDTRSMNTTLSCWRVKAKVVVFISYELPHIRRCHWPPGCCAAGGRV